MNEEKEKLIFECLYILIADPDGNNEQVRRHLMKELNKVLSPPEQTSIAERTHDAFSQSNVESESSE